MTTNNTETNTTTTTTTTTTTGIEQWDLTGTVSSYIDRHMIFPLLDYVDKLVEKGSVSYSSKDIAEARLALLRPTHMVDYAIDTYKSVHGQDAAVPKEMEEQKEAVMKELKALQEKCEPLEKFANDNEQREKLIGAGNWNIEYLHSADSAITEEVVEAYRQCARYKFECGDYESARTILTNYIALVAHPPAQAVTTNEDDEELIAAGIHQQQQNKKTDSRDTGNASMYYLKSIDSNMLHVLWGRLACEILVLDWPAASVAVDAVKNGIETMVSSKQLSSLQALQQRTWLLHWSLFVYWNHSKGGLEHLVELFHTEKYKQAITTNAPHLLRYLTAAVLLCKRRVTKKGAASSTAEARKLMKNLIYVMQDCEYTDPIVEFVNCLCVKFDFDSAQTKLAECEKVLAADFFLCEQTSLFMEEARVFVFENYCRIHNKIDLIALGEKLAMDQLQAERWIVDLIRNADLDAKIDSNAGCVIMGGSPQSIYEQVMDRTRDLNVRSATLVQNLNNLLNEARKDKIKKDKMNREDDY